MLQLLRQLIHMETMRRHHPATNVDNYFVAICYAFVRNTVNGTLPAFVSAVYQFLLWSWCAETFEVASIRGIVRLLLHSAHLQWWRNNTLANAAGSELEAHRAATTVEWRQSEGRARKSRLLPPGLIYRPALGCYCADLLQRPEVNCPTLGSISNRTVPDMGPDTSKRRHYIIPCCSGKWSLPTPPPEKSHHPEGGSGDPVAAPGMSSPDRQGHWLIHQQQPIPSSPSSTKTNEPGRWCRLGFPLAASFSPTLCATAGDKVTNSFQWVQVNLEAEKRLSWLLKNHSAGGKETFFPQASVITVQTRTPPDPLNQF